MNAAGPLANGLYPIIRRARRPFIIADDDAAPAPTQPPVATPPVVTLKPQGEAKKKSNDGTSKI